MRIEISRLTKTYGGDVHALNGIDLDVPTGMYGLLSSNGAGKTTLMRILAGFAGPPPGTVRVGGHDVGTARRRERGRTPGARIPPPGARGSTPS